MAVEAPVKPGPTIQAWWHSHASWCLKTKVTIWKLTPIVSSAKKETDGQVETKVTGTIPDWVEGHMMRNGAAQWDIEHKGKTETVNHWFDGHRIGCSSLRSQSWLKLGKSPVKSLLHRFTIKNGQVNYKNKFLRSDVYAKNRKYDRFIYGGFGTPQRHSDPCKNIFERFVAYFSPPEKDFKTALIHTTFSKFQILTCKADRQL